MMATCNASTLTSSVWREMSPLPFAQNAVKTSRLQRTMFIANARMVQQGIVRIAKSVASRVAEKIGQGPFIRLSLRQTCKLARFVMWTSHWKRFTQTAVLRMAQRNTVADAKVVCLQGRSKISQSCTLQKHKNAQQAPKISFLAFSITQQNANKILGLTLILSIFFNFTSNNKVVAPCLELK